MSREDKLNRQRWVKNQRKKAAVSFASVLSGVERQRANEIALLRQQIAFMADNPHMAVLMEQSKARLAHLEST